MQTLTRNTPETLRALIEKQTLERFIKEGMTPEVHYKHAIQTKVIPGKKYIKIDVGTSGRYMIDADGQIFGIKAYGVIHKGHFYGTLDTIDLYDWSNYTAVKKTYSTEKYNIN